MKKTLIIIMLAIVALLPQFVAGQERCLSLDGSKSYVRLDNRLVEGDFTLETWIKTTDTRGGSHFYKGKPVIYSDKGGAANDFGSSVLNGKFAFGTGTADRTIQSNTPVNTGEWMHVAATREQISGTIRVYINGIEETSVNSANTKALNSTNYINFGGNHLDGLYLIGYMDEVRLWNRVLTAAEITANMKKPLTGNENGLVGYYNFEEFTFEGNIMDLSPRENHGKLKGDAKLAKDNAPIEYQPEPVDTTIIDESEQEKSESQQPPPTDDISLTWVIVIILIVVVIILIIIIVILSKKGKKEKKE